ncbi:MAG: hypothetical protein CMI18_02765 [Opitutaceae bacterium]|nr:hypothetical protein [Opitutaceae bacterium]|tara:strand:+ start:2084 stop:2944 length:861 start_codon:yes stop_codon:yes gene_type:complete
MRFTFQLFIYLAAICLANAETWQINARISEKLAGRSVVIEHGVIPGLAEEAGQIEVSLTEGDYAIAEAGRQIRGTLSAEADGLKLAGIWPAELDLQQTMMLINRELTRPRLSRVGKKMLTVGDKLPRFALYNQRGKLVTPDNLKGKVVVLNFIFTRSKVPSMCPATTRRMVELQQLLIKNGFRNEVRQVSLTLDPEYDTPGICYEYLDEQGVDHDTFWLMTGPPQVLGQLTKEIGVVSTPSEKSILNHSMVTLILDKESKVFFRKPGTRWEVKDIYDRMEILLKPW